MYIENVYNSFSNEREKGKCKAEYKGTSSYNFKIWVLKKSILQQV